ncbi:MAG TPA: Trk system potassium transporter TrkA [Clostridiaceae bacterium]|nr:Trk system potassium transporter TrkA [Clostridiaceae bacterium]
MKIVVCGLGKVGEVLSRDLSREQQDVITIDKNEQRLRQLIMSVDVTGIAGGGSFLDVQMEAGVNECDVFIAVTPDDETNIMAAITAKTIGAKYAIARVRSPEYFKQLDFLRESLGIDMLINPDLEAAKEIKNMFVFPSALSVENFGDGKIFIVEAKLEEKSPLLGKSLREIGRKHGNVLVGVVERGEEIFIPDGDYIIERDDKLFVTGEPGEILRFLQSIRGVLHKPKSALIIGGSRITRYLLKMLKKQKLKLKVIEHDEEIANRLAVKYPHVEVVCADGTDQNTLREERIQNYDYVIALTGIDEENLLISLYASSQGVKNTVTKVNRTNLLKVLDNVGLQAIITPNKLIADHIIRLVRSLQNSSGSSIEDFYRISEGKVEIIQFHVASGSPVCERKLKDLPIKSGLLILCILRQGEIIFPDGNDCLQAEDSTIVVTTEPNFQDVRDILEEI